MRTEPRQDSGKKGFWTVPNIAPLDCTVIEKPDEEFSEEWCIVNGNSAETPFYKIKFAPDGSITGLYDKSLGQGVGKRSI